MTEEEKLFAEKIGKEAKRVTKRLKVQSVIVIAIFKEGDNLKFADAGAFPCSPEQFYQLMKQSHQQQNSSVIQGTRH